MLSSNKLIQISSRLNRLMINGQLRSVRSDRQLPDGEATTSTTRSTTRSTIESRIDENNSSNYLSVKSINAINSRAIFRTSSIFSSNIGSIIHFNPIIKTATSRSLNPSQTASFHTQPTSVRRLSSSAVPEDVDKSKDPFLEIDGLSKRKSRARSVFAWGLSATGAVGNTKYFNLGDLKYEKILKPFKIRYFNSMKVSN